MARPVIHTALELENPLTFSYEQVLTALRDGEVEDEYGLMRWGSNYTFLVTVKHCDQAFLAIYKPRIGECPLWDFPDGTLCQRETASYVVSAALGWEIVPPTILREGPRGIGSLQVFINHDPNRHYFTFDEAQDAGVMQMAAFDAIVNNADRKGGHCLLDEDERLWGIDHGLTFHPANKLRTVIWDHAGQPVPDALLADIERLCQTLEDDEHTCTAELNTLLSIHEMKALKRRVNKLLNTGTFPLPGSGPNRPWPAI